jgi:hypothetical protein
MKTTRKRHSAELKVKVAQEAIRGDLPLAELAAKQGILHTSVPLRAGALLGSGYGNRATMRKKNKQTQ